MDKINREDMLELTRRMTLKRNCFDRIAGAYMDEEGFVDGTFNKHFQKLSLKDQQANLAIAKAVPFSETNTELKEYVFREGDRKPGSIWQMLMALRECGLKNDAMLDVLGVNIRHSAAMRSIFSMAATTCISKLAIKKVCGNPRRSTGS